MASGKEYLEFVLEQLSGLDGVTHRAMMGEYILYYQGKVAGGIYDNRLLVKPVPAARSYLPAAPLQAPYPGAKELLLVEDVDNRDVVCGLFRAIYAELPAPKPKRKKAPTASPC